MASGLMKREVVKALRKKECGKGVGVDGIAVDILKKEYDCVADWSIRIFDVCMDYDEMSDDWWNVCIMPLYKEMEYIDELSN